MCNSCVWNENREKRCGALRKLRKFNFSSLEETRESESEEKLKLESRENYLLFFWEILCLRFQLAAEQKPGGEIEYLEFDYIEDGSLLETVISIEVVETRSKVYLLKSLTLYIATVKWHLKLLAMCFSRPLRSTKYFQPLSHTCTGELLPHKNVIKWTRFFLRRQFWLNAIRHTQFFFLFLAFYQSFREIRLIPENLFR